MPALRSKGTASAQMVVRRASDAPKLAIEMTSPVVHKLLDFIVANRALYTEGVTPNEFVEQAVAICGAGPSLRGASFSAVSQVWACNSALPYLHAQGVGLTRPLSGVGIDQTPGMLRDWSDAPDVTYYVASSCDPELVRHLLAHNRRVRFFHNAVGVIPAGYATEFDYYRATWPEPNLMVGEGANVVSRVIYLAEGAGFERFDIHGADCCFADGDVAHANGEVATEAYNHPLIMEGEVNGKKFRARPDMLLEAVDLVRKVRRYKGRVRLVGNTLPVALLGKDDTYLDLVMRRLQPGELTGESNHGQ